ncbi:cytochrome P450 [Pseudonocardia sp. CA-107938]|uniref:cytochrome P450 n=1 Tax=Pseudonocardia sp. CA-107938 TaxID=3240021 RepID=UPI003D8E2D2A
MVSAQKCPVELPDGYDPFSGAQLIDPHPVWELARAEMPVFRSPVLDAWVITRNADVVAVLRDPATFGSVVSRKMFAETCPEADRLLDALPPLAETNPLASSPPVHTKLRRYLQPSFTPRRVATLEPDVRAIADSLVDRMVPAGHADFYAAFAYRYPLLVIFRLLGMPESDQEKVKGWANQRLALRYGKLAPQEQLVAARAQHDYHRYCTALVAERRRDPGQDLLSWMVADSDAGDDPLTEDQLASQVTSLLTAGHETTAHWLTLALRRLLSDRRQWEALVADPHPTTAQLEESLRIDGPVLSLWREARTDVELGGATIRAGERVSVVLGSANADGEVFPEPARFDPSRPNVAAHLAFGRGIHTCVGAGLARLEGRIALEVLATRLPTLRLAAHDGFRIVPSATQRAAQRLFVEW